MAANILAGRTSSWTFAIGCVAVTIGVLLHVQMFADAGSMNYHLAGMDMGWGMTAGMALIVLGLLTAGHGLLPVSRLQKHEHRQTEVFIETTEDTRLTPAHWALMGVMAVALVIDTMKPATLGFVVPGMRTEYGVPQSTVALLPFCALTGTAVGSIVWGILADIYGRRASILLSAIMFVGTAICGAMPSLTWNLVMCFMMGASAGGMLPVAYALLAETMPTKSRGWVLVLIGGLGTAGGYLVASGASNLLQPIFGWRIMWLLGLPTGLLLIILNPFIPESPKFLVFEGRIDEARAAMKRFGSIIHIRPLGSQETAELPHKQKSILRSLSFIKTTSALTITGLTWGLLNFGVLLWLPSELGARGYDIARASQLLALSTVIALPAVVITALAYSLWSTKYTLVASVAITLVGLLGLLLLDYPVPGLDNPLIFMTLLIVGVNCVIATILPYAAENYPLYVRGRATGWVAGMTKAGGIGAQLFGLFGVTPAIGVAAAVLSVPTLISTLLVTFWGSETRGRALSDLELFEAEKPTMLDTPLD
jgi:putative MFS transporter